MTWQCHYWAYTLRKPQFKKYPNIQCSTTDIARTWKRPRSPSTDEWMKMCYIYTVDY